MLPCRCRRREFRVCLAIARPELWGRGRARPLPLPPVMKLFAFVPMFAPTGADQRDTMLRRSDAAGGQMLRRNDEIVRQCGDALEARDIEQDSAAENRLHSTVSTPKAWSTPSAA